MKWRVNMNRREILGVVFDMDGLMFDSERRWAMGLWEIISIIR